MTRKSSSRSLLRRMVPRLGNTVEQDWAWRSLSASSICWAVTSACTAPRGMEASLSSNCRQNSALLNLTKDCGIPLKPKPCNTPKTRKDACRFFVLLECFAVKKHFSGCPLRACRRFGLRPVRDHHLRKPGNAPARPLIVWQPPEICPAQAWV